MTQRPGPHPRAGRPSSTTSSTPSPPCRGGRGLESNCRRTSSRLRGRASTARPFRGHPPRCRHPRPPGRAAPEASTSPSRSRRSSGTASSAPSPCPGPEESRPNFSAIRTGRPRPLAPADVVSLKDYGSCRERVTKRPDGPVHARAFVQPPSRPPRAGPSASSASSPTASSRTQTLKYEEDVTVAARARTAQGPPSSDVCTRPSGSGEVLVAQGQRDPGRPPARCS